MTGNTIGVHGEFAYYNDRHYVGPVKMLGFSAANADEFAGLTLLPQYTSYLAKHPSTAQHLATKLATRFVSDTPPASLINTLASVYLANNTAIVPVLKALFASAEFAASIGQKTRRPDRGRDRCRPDPRRHPRRRRRQQPGRPLLAAEHDGSGTARLEPAERLPRCRRRLAVGRRHDAALECPHRAWSAAGGPMAWRLRRQPPCSHATPPATIGALIDALSVRLIGVKLTGAQRSAIVNFACSRTAGSTENTSSANTIRWDLGAVTTLILNTPNWIER